MQSLRPVFRRESTPPGERRSSRSVALAAFVQEHFLRGVADTSVHEESPERQIQELNSIKRDIEDLHDYGRSGRSDALTAAFGFFGDALFGTSDRDIAVRAATSTLDTVIARLDGIEGGGSAGMNRQSALHGLEHRLSDQFSAHSGRRDGGRGEPLTKRNEMPGPHR